MAHEFLSDGWFDAVEALGAPPLGPGPFDGPLNLVVTRDDDEALEINVDGGTVSKGRSTTAPTTVTTTFAVAKALVVEGDQHAAMQAFMAGQVQVEGDMARLQVMGTRVPNDEQRAYLGSIRALTMP